MPGLLHRALGAFLIVLALSGCDNVEWGGVEVGLDPPPGSGDTLAASADSGGAAAAPAEPTLPEGPVLYTVTRTGSNDPGRGVLRPVAAIAPDTLLSLPWTPPGEEGFTRLFVEDRLAPGREFTLFAQGFRVGTARVESVAFEPGRCGPVPTAGVVLELLPQAAQLTGFAALPRGRGLPREGGEFRDHAHSYDQRVAGLELATEAITRSGAPWPGSVLETRADMRALPLDGDPTGAIAGTFLFQDALRVGPPLTRAAYGIFILGTGGPESYRMAYMDYRRVEDGKAAMRYFEQADWDEDGETEILLEVFGEQARWMAALDRRGGGWVRVFEERCAGPAPGA
ncbi:MAG: hypothetical protein RQ751_09675 [Longimicrobiales bacterium]|nr:hypothetical protein [Longimicrobiales bacterium]